MQRDTVSVLMRQHELAWRLACHHLAGLENDECLWRPSDRGLHVTVDRDGSWRGEWPSHERYDLGPPSIAWLLWHMDYWWSRVIDHSFGDVVRGEDDLASPGDVDAIRRRLTALHEAWMREMGALDDDDLRSAERTGWPYRNRPFCDVAAWVNVELTKNAAEIGYARFLYAVRASADPP